MSDNINLINFINLNLAEKEMVLSWRNHPSIKKWMYNNNDITLENHLLFIETLKKSEDKLYFLVKQNKQYLGVIDFTNIQRDIKSTEFGLYANTNLRGMGNILLSNVCKYGFENLNMDKLIAEVFITNIKAINLYKRFNFKETTKKMVNNNKVISMELNMKIGNFDLEKDGTYIIAELSANHGGKIEIAKETIKAAKEIGANAVKLQTYTADTLTLDCKNDDFIIKGGTLWDNIKLYDLYKEAYLPWEWHKELFEYARNLDIDIFSSPFDRSAVDFLEQFNPSAYKIASFEITDYELIRYTASKCKPIIISTGIATIDEIQDAVEICRSVGNENIILLKCTSAYPAPLEDANLKTIPNLAETFGVISGFSDHTLGSIAPISAVTLGAKVIEKHFILDKSIGGADAEFSMDKKEFKNMIKDIRDVEKLLGKVDYTMTEKKKKSRQFSRSLYVSKDINKGDIFSKENIRSVRPGYGMHPKYLNDILGTMSTKNYKFGDRL